MTTRRQRHWFSAEAVLVALLITGCVAPARGAGIDFPGPDPGVASGTEDSGRLVMENEVIASTWQLAGGQLKPASVTDKLSGTTIALKGAECFQVILGDGEIVKASDMKIVGAPTWKTLRANADSPRLAERLGGKRVLLRLASPDAHLEVEWRAVLRDGSNYIRQELTFIAKDEAVEIAEIVLLDLPAPQPRVVGVVDGSPVVAGNLFFAYEHPMSKSTVSGEGDGQRLRCSLLRGSPVKPGERMVQSSVIGVVPEGQLRRGFLHYLERERAHPYRPFLHYNSWFDIAWHTRKMTEKECLEATEAFGQELVRKRGVKLDSFVFDDGWDDNTTLWGFNDGFPNGFKRLRDAAAKYDSAVGTWLSPWGGWSTAGNERRKYGREQGFEMDERGFTLAGPKYYARFRDVCLNMMRVSGVNYFKFDGIGARSVGNIEGMLRLSNELRNADQEVFLNITNGTWPSPYWLWHSDTTWRAGGDTGAHGKGSKRQQWITYRDSQTYGNVVKRGPLFPLNSIMLHGIVFARRGEAEVIVRNVPELLDEIRSYFGSGTHLQELYITAGMITPEAWDTLAEAAKWSRANADVLVDTHWVGGNAGEGEVYGWASWSKRKGILVLRNPDDAPARIGLDIGAAFELPKGAAQKYSLKSPWKKDAAEAAIAVRAGTEHTFELKPFEVLVFDAMPVE